MEAPGDNGHRFPPADSLALPKIKHGVLWTTDGYVVRGRGARYRCTPRTGNACSHRFFGPVGQASLCPC